MIQSLGFPCQFLFGAPNPRASRAACGRGAQIHWDDFILTCQRRKISKLLTFTEPHVRPFNNISSGRENKFIRHTSGGEAPLSLFTCPDNQGALFVNKPLSNSTPHDLSRCQKTRLLSPCAINYDVGQSDGPGYSSVLMKLWDSFPQSVRSFPWTKAFISFYELISELTRAVAKYLCVPVLAVSSLSEMSYCAHERKMPLIPVPLLAGFAVAGALKDAAIELSPDLKEGGFPGHLLLIAIFFLLLKLPGPQYPYWLRLIVPHFANGGLWRTAWSSFVWYKKGETVAEKPSEDMKQ